MSTPMVHTTPTKRKREELKERQMQHINYGVNKENYFTVYNNFMEVKSIADLVDKKSKPIDNPFEVARKPPKKKDRKDLTAENCFVNPALDLNVPENIINPFEVKRSATMPEAVQNCYENSGLNLRVNERKLANPFEVPRQTTAGDLNRGLYFCVYLVVSTTTLNSNNFSHCNNYAFF